MSDQEKIELTDELVLELGNEILKTIGAEEEITEIESFCTDELYLQLFKALFPQLPIKELQPGESAEEVAQNLFTLINLLGEYILEKDLRYISATSIIEGDLTHLSEFLQILLQVVALLKEYEESNDGSSKSQQISDKEHPDPMGMDRPVIGGSGEINLEPQDDNMNLGINSDEELKIGSPNKHDPVIENESPEQIRKSTPKIDSSPQEDVLMKPESPKPKIDLFNDPLLPDDMDVPRSSGKKKKSAVGSFGGNDGNHLENDGEIDLQNLTDEDRALLVQELYEQYEADPNNFPEDQRKFLEEQMLYLMDKGYIEAEEESEQDERMKVKGEMNFPKEPLPFKDDKEEIQEIANQQEEIDVDEVQMNQNQLNFYHKEEQKDESHEEEMQDNQYKAEEIKNYQPDEEAEIFQQKIMSDQSDDHDESNPAERTDESEIDERTKLQILQKMQEEQQKISQRVSRRTKPSKKKKKKSPSTPKYSFGMMRDRYPRPWASNAVKPKKKKKKLRKNIPQDVYREQMRQQQILHALAMEQQKMENQNYRGQNAHSPGNIEITPEQAILLYQQLTERQNAGEDLTNEELEQLQFLRTLLEQNAANQNQINQVSRPSSYLSKKPRRKKSTIKRKPRSRGRSKKAKRNLEQDQLLMYQQHLQMLQQQQLQEQQQKLAPSNPNIELPDGVEEIKEVENEDTPNQELHSNDMSDDKHESEQENEITSEQEIPPQINVKAPAKFRMEEEEEEDSKIDQPLEYYDAEGNINPEVLQSLSPEQLHQLQQLQAQQEPSEVSGQQFDPNDPQNLVTMDQMMRMSHQNDLLQKEFQSVKPLSKSVSKVIKRFKSMRKYELDVYDKKFQTELRKAQQASNRGEYFQEILRQSLESALLQRGLDGKGIMGKTNNLSKFVTPLMQY